MPGNELTCQELVELVTAYLEGALAPQARDRFATHLAGCRGCQAYLRQMERTIRLAGCLTEDTLPEGARQHLLDAFRTWKAPRPG